MVLPVERKSCLIFVLALFVSVSISGTASGYRHEAVDIAPGNFSYGEFYFPGQLMINESVGIGTLYPQTKLDVETEDENSVISIGSGLTSPFFSSIDFYDRGTNEWGIGKDTSNNFYIDESGVATRLIILPGGNVGIGTSSPTERLDIQGNLRIRNLVNCDTIDTDASGNLVCGTDDTGAGGDDLGSHIATQNIQLNSHWLSGDGDDEGVFVDSSGRVGVGTSGPVTQLMVDENSDLNSIVSIDSGSSISRYSSIDFYDRGTNEWGIGKDASNNFYIDESGVANRLIILPGGNVGIGTSSPTERLDVAGRIRGTELCIGSDCQSVWPVDTDTRCDVSGICSQVCIGSDCQSVWPSGGDTDWTESGGNVYRETGNVGIGTTSPGAKLEVAGQVKITGGSPAEGSILTSDASGLASWQPVSGFTCPSGFTLIESQGVQLGCIQNIEQGDDDYFAAQQDCFNTYGGRLPMTGEWYLAMNNYDLTGETGNNEWMGDTAYYPDVGVVVIACGQFGITSCGGRLPSWSGPYRCWIPA